MPAGSHIFAAAAIAIASLAIPIPLRAQAPAGPIRPMRTDADTNAPAEAEKKPLPRHELWGHWTLNAKRSDDTTAKLQKARGTRATPMWGGFPRGGGADRESVADHNREDDVIYPQNSLALAHKDAEIDLTDDQGRKRVYFTDGRKLQKSKDDKYKELAARWDAWPPSKRRKRPQHNQANPLVRNFPRRPTSLRNASGRSRRRKRLHPTPLYLRSQQSRIRKMPR